jgi:hypothetical protein
MTNPPSAEEIENACVEDLGCGPELQLDSTNENRNGSATLCMETPKLKLETSKPVRPSVSFSKASDYPSSPAFRIRPRSRASRCLIFGRIERTHQRRDILARVNPHPVPVV